MTHFFFRRSKISLISIRSSSEQVSKFEITSCNNEGFVISGEKNSRGVK